MNRTTFVKTLHRVPGGRGGIGTAVLGLGLGLALTALTFVALAGLTLAGCTYEVNGLHFTNQPPRASDIALPDQVLTVGRALTISKAESLFWDDDPLTLTATSSDTTVVAVSLAIEEDSYSLTFEAWSLGIATVSIVATEPEGDGSGDDQQPQGRSVTRTVVVTVVESAPLRAPL